MICGKQVADKICGLEQKSDPKTNIWNRKNYSKVWQNLKNGRKFKVILKVIFFSSSYKSPTS